MRRKLFGRYLLSAFTLLSLRTTAIYGSSICEHKGVSSKPILCVGMLRKSLLVVTVPEGKLHTQDVYEMPVTSLDTSLDRLYINQKPQTLKEKWPELYRNPYYGNATFGGLIYNSFTAIDQDSEYFLLNTQMGKSPLDGVCFDITKREAFKGMAYKGTQQQVVISSNELDHFFAITIGDNKGLHIMRYRFAEKTVKASMAKDHDAIVPESTDPFYPLCSVGKDSIMMVKGASSSCKPLTWPLTKGFVSGQKVYLFGEESIHIFPRSFYEEPNKPVNVTYVKYADFIQCSAVVEKKTPSAAGMSVGLIIGIVLVVLIVLLCLVLFCTREVVKRKRRKRKKHKKGQKDEPEPPLSGILSFFAGPSARSAGDDEGPGKLSHVNQHSNVNSQVSIRSNMPSNAAWKLSAHGRNSVRSGSASKLSGKLSIKVGGASAFSNATTGRSAMSQGASKAFHGASVATTARSSMSKVKNSRAH